jgi:hypothetical protein
MVANTIYMVKKFSDVLKWKTALTTKSPLVRAFK